MKKFLAYLATVLVVATYSNFASAVSATCQSVQTPPAGCTGTCLISWQAQAQLTLANHPECTGATASTSTATQEIASTSFSQMLSISRAVSARNMAGNTRPQNTASLDQRFGMAAGNSPAQWNFWGSVSSDKNKYDRGVYFDPVGLNSHNHTSNTNVTNAVLGGDYQLAPTVAIGVSAAFDSSSGNASSTNVTAGTAPSYSTSSTSGYTVAPYLGWQINQDWSLDASLGMGSVKLNTTEVSGKADRVFYGTNLSYASWMGNWQLSGKGSYLHGQEKYGNLTSGTGALMANSATTNKMGQLRVGGQAGYWMNDSVMPYFGLSYASDISRSTSSTTSQLGSEIGRTAWVYSLGANFFSIKNSITGGVAYNQETGRTYAKNNSLMGNINFRF
ncbi:MAG: autotransporter outer membrane beta-barrel domain-containing protein [Gallionella sp.]|jgi:hypothetical protein